MVPGDIEEYFKKFGFPLSFAENTIILNQGAAPSGIYLIMDGNVEIRFFSARGLPFRLARLGAGELFGEMSCIRKEVTSADVVALTPVTLIHIPFEQFESALKNCPALNSFILKLLADNLHKTSQDAWSLFRRAETLNLLVFGQEKNTEFIASSSRMKKILKKMESLAAADNDLSIVGEKGTGKLSAAIQIHSLSKRTGPLFIIDCRKFEDISPERLLLGGPDWESESPFLNTFGAIHLADDGTLILKNAELLELETFRQIHRYCLYRQSCSETCYPAARIIFTVNVSGSDTTGYNNSATQVVKTGETDILTMPRLAERKSDILPLAHFFLRQFSPHKSFTLTRNLEHMLLSMHFRRNNITELKEIIESAALLSEDGIIDEEHLFFSSRDENIPAERELVDAEKLKILVNKPYLKYTRWIVGLSFFMIMVICLFFPDTFIGEISNAMIWTVWEPLLILSFLFIGHAWCTICPLSTYARGIIPTNTSRPAPSPVVKKYSVWFGIAGFMLIIWSELYFHMITNPRASGFLLLGLVGGALLLRYLYRREVWCRYICPLGYLATTFSLPAMVHIRATSQVCSSTCKTHSCHMGDEKREGCPSFHHPAYIAESFHCKMCFDCVDLCPHGAVNVYLRPFLQGITYFSHWSYALFPFFIFLILSSPILLLVQKFHFYDKPSVFTALFLLNIGLSYFINDRLKKTSSAKNEGLNEVFPLLLFSFLLFSWGALMVYQVGNIHLLESIALVYRTETFSAESRGSLTLAYLLQIVLFLFSAFSALFVLRKSWCEVAREKNSPHHRIFRLSGLWLTLYFFLLLFLVTH